ncbi:MAG: hypothetical protein M3Q69_12300 [Acidobacteriota bacterium]|nr:hypothetical protein [Acidobacteriota bacterium]
MRERAGGAPGADPTKYTEIHGRRHPELLMPTEILSIFVMTAYSQAEDEVARAAREDAARKAHDLGLPDDFMKTFEYQCRPFIEAQMREFHVMDRIQAERGDVRELWKELQAVREEECPLRVAALDALRGIYGERFDEFLYVAIAPNAFTTGGNPKTYSDELRRKEAGCR